MLNRQSIALPPGIAPPAYDVSQVTAGIVHIGLGGFHRAHLARYTHDLMELDPSALSWGIAGAGLRPSDAPLLEALRRQDGLYTLVERDGDGERKTLIGSIVGTIDASADTAALLDAIAQPEIRIVSITVSENGYHLDGATRKLNENDPAILRDVANPHAPKTILGILAESFRRRREAGLPPFTVLTCDNIQENGEIVRDAVLALATMIDAELFNWIARTARFPCSMVDRITPVPTTAQIEAFQKQTGFADEAPVFAESFRQWVVEDSFSNGRPAWDRVGAQFVVNVTPYEKMKLRLLNASHLATAGLGALSGHQTVQETIGDPFIRRYMERLMASETAPTLGAVPGIDLANYQRTLIERFTNPAIPDSVQRINADAPVNLLLDPLRDRLASGDSIDLLGLGLAAWLLRVKVESVRPVDDRPMGKAEHQLQSVARRINDPVAFLSEERIFGDVGRNPRLISSVEHWVRLLQKEGPVETLHRAGRTNLL